MQAGWWGCRALLPDRTPVKLNLMRWRVRSVSTEFGAQCSCKKLTHTVLIATQIIYFFHSIVSDFLLKLIQKHLKIRIPIHAEESTVLFGCKVAFFLVRFETKNIFLHASPTVLVKAFIK